VGDGYEARVMIEAVCGISVVSRDQPVVLHQQHRGQPWSFIALYDHRRVASVAPSGTVLSSLNMASMHAMGAKDRLQWKWSPELGRVGWESGGRSNGGEYVHPTRPRWCRPGSSISTLPVRVSKSVLILLKPCHALHCPTSGTWHHHRVTDSDGMLVSNFCVTPRDRFACTYSGPHFTSWYASVLWGNPHLDPAHVGVCKSIGGLKSHQLTYMITQYPTTRQWPPLSLLSKQMPTRY